MKHIALRTLMAATLTLGTFALPTVVSADETVMTAKKARYEGEVVLMRGGFNVFSKGMDEMAAVLRKRGVKARVMGHRRRAEAVAAIMQNRKRFGRKPVILIGHSWGANSVIAIANILKSKGVRVSYIATFAATNPGAIPSNVRKATNYYFKNGGWGEPVRRGKGFRGTLKNIDLSTKSGVHHFNVEQVPRLQRQVIRNVLRFIGRRKSV